MRLCRGSDCKTCSHPLCHSLPAACFPLSQGTSRGGANIKEIVRRIDLWGLDMVFVVGGNGGNAAANAIQEEVERQGLRCVVAGVPKSIDNDILLVSVRSWWKLDGCLASITGYNKRMIEVQAAMHGWHDHYC